MSVEKLIILGTGYTGIKLARKAIDSGYEVVGTTRDDDTIETLRSLGAIPIRWSVDQSPDDWAAHLGPSTALVYSIPTLYRRHESNDTGLDRHVAPVAGVADRCRQQGVDRLIYLSSTSVYGDHGGDWVDEATPCRPSSAYGQMRLDIERYLQSLQTDFPVTIARLVGIYGPGRTLADYIDAGRYTLVDGGKKVTNRIHVHDIARALLAIVERGPDEHRIFNLTDGHPQQVRDLVEYVCDTTDLDAPPEKSLEEYIEDSDSPNKAARWKKQIRVLNDRLRDELDFQLTYPDVFAGYQAILT